MKVGFWILHFVQNDCENMNLLLNNIKILKDSYSDTEHSEVEESSLTAISGFFTPFRMTERSISTHEGGHYPMHPLPPTDLIAELLPSGSIELDWSRNGNAPGTQFVIEYSLPPTGTWTLLDVITKTSYVHTGHPLGQAIRYTIKARKNNETNIASNIALVG